MNRFNVSSADIYILILNYSRQYNHFGYTAKECDNLTLDS